MTLEFYGYSNMNSFLLSSISLSHGKTSVILEPLQSMIQLALLSLCPIGTKLTIHDNIVSLHYPTLIQPLARWYHSDRKDDLYFLYAVLRRFIKWYDPATNKKSPLPVEMYQLILSMSMEGLTQLLKTYHSSDCNTVIQVIHMYRHMLEHPSHTFQEESEEQGMEAVFETIRSLYDSTLLQVIYHTLLFVRKEPLAIHQQTMMDGLFLLMQKNHQDIKEWIHLHLSV